MKTIFTVLLLSAVVVYGFSDENIPEENYIGTGNLYFGQPVFNNNTEPLSINCLNLNLFIFNNGSIYSLNNFSYNVLNKTLFSNNHETNISIQDRIDSLNAFKLYGGLVLMLAGYFENKENIRNFIYLEEQWNKMIHEEQLNQWSAKK
jgi:hypothetical protein